MTDGVWRVLSRNESADTSGWPRVDGNAASWPRGPRTAARKRWEVLHWDDDGDIPGSVYEYDTLDNAVAALNKRPSEAGLAIAAAPGVHHSRRLWYGLRAGRCPQKHLGLVSKVWLRPIRRPDRRSSPPEPSPTSADKKSDGR